MARSRKTPPKRNQTDARAASSARRGRRRRGKRTLHWLLLLLFVLAAGAVLSMTVLFQIEEVRVVGLDKYAPEAVIEASGVLAGDNLLRISAAEIEQNILDQFPYIESVQVRRRFPPAVELRVTQATAVGAVLNGEVVTLIDQNGKLLEQGDLYVPPELPIIQGLDLSGCKPGDYLEGENREKLVMLQYLFEAAGAVSFGPITNIDVTDRLNMRMVYEARLVILLGSEADMEYKLRFIQWVIDDLEPDAQARIDATNIASKRVLVKFGRVAGGEFEAVSSSVFDQVFQIPEEDEPSGEQEIDSQNDGGADA